MGSTYDKSHGTQRDLVRFLVGDTDTSSPRFDDAEIDAILGEETATGASRPYFAAATILGAIQTELAGVGAGLAEKSVDGLKLKWGIDAVASQAIEMKISQLRKRGAFLLATKGQRVFRAVRT